MILELSLLVLMEVLVMIGYLRRVALLRFRLAGWVIVNLMALRVRWVMWFLVPFFVVMLVFIAVLLAVFVGPGCGDNAQKTQNIPDCYPTAGTRYAPESA